jgi:hypothetical protein
VVNGYIEFSIGGANESRAAFGRQTIDATKNENAVIFTKKQSAAFAELRAAIEAAIAAN